MQWAEVAFLDVAVMDFIRERHLAGDCVAVVDRDTLRMRWVNGAANAALRVGELGAVLDADRPLVTGAGARQLKSATMRRADDKVTASVRLGIDIRQPLHTVDVYPFAGDPQRFATVAFASGMGPDDAEMTALSGLTAGGATAAIADEAGMILAATPGFEDSKLAASDRSALCAECADEGDRMVKRLVRTQGGDALAVGVGRLSDQPGRYLFLVMASGAPTSSLGVDDALDNVSDLPVFDDANTSDMKEPDASEPTRLEFETPLVAPPMATEDPADLKDTPVEEVSPLEPAEAETQDADEDEEEAEQQPSVAWSPDGIPSSPIRFVWKTDRNAVFVDVSDEFAQAVGPEHAALIGKSFAQVSSELGLDPSGEIAASLTRRDTWSGKSVLWPIQSTDLRVPVDLAALPYYDRDRNFEGYRGFGIARMADIIVDQTHGERGSVQWVEDDDEADTDDTTLGDIDSGTVAEPSDTSDDPFNGEPPALYSATITPFRRLSDQPSLEPDDEADISEPGDANIGATDQVGDEADGVFDIAAGEDDQDAASENVVIRPLSESEADAFDQIAAQLRPAGSAAADNDDNAAETALAVQGLGPDALDALPLSLLIVREEEALYANEAFAALTGYETVDAINVRGLNDLFGEPAPTDSDAAALSLRHADGSAILVNSHLQRVPWMNQNALMFAFEALPDAPSAASMDSTSPAISPSDIAEENTELRAILDTATDGVITLNADGDIRSMNAAATALFGYDGDALIGQSFSILFAHESQKRVLDYLDSMTSNGVANVLNEGLETTGREAKGGEIKLFMTLGRLASSRGFCAVLRDITAWKRNEQALEEARKQAEDASEMKSAFLAKVSHEIRTPLNAIIGFSEIMSEERFGPIGNERYTDYLEDIQKSGRYVLELVNDLLDISKIESGNEDLDFESVSLNEQVLDVIDMLRPQANRNRIIMRSGLDPDLPDVVADIRATKQIIINLLTNAVRYTPEGGQVVISTRYLNDGAVVLRIRDTGIGMSAEELEGALRPFKQVSANEGMRSSGTGLGLPLTRALVEANRAGFTIQSEPGAGTNVEINFPPPRVLAQ